MVDDGFEVRAYVWLLLWYGFFVFDTVRKYVWGLFAVCATPAWLAKGGGGMGGSLTASICTACTASICTRGDASGVVRMVHSAFIVRQEVMAIGCE